MRNSNGAAHGHNPGASTIAPRRFKGDFACPICGGAEDDKRGVGSRCRGFLSADGRYANCSREDHARSAKYDPRSETYLHRLQGPCNCGVEHTPADPQPDRKARGKAKDFGTIEEVYPYRDEAGVLLSEAVRFRDPKDFRQRRPNGNGGWVWSLGDTRNVLYRLPELLAAVGQVVYVAEGEKAVGALVTRGFVATCSPMGAGKWRPAHSESLTGRHVVILPDNDQAGREHAQAVARSLRGKAASVKVVELPGLPEKGDPFDYFAAGGTAAALKTLVGGAPPWEPPADTAAASDGSIDDQLARFPRTDLGNAERLVARHGQDLRYCHPWERYLGWDGRRWKLDDTGEARRRAKRTVRAILGEAKTIEDDEKRKAHALWALASEKRDKISAMLHLAEVEDGIPILPAAMDADPWLFNCRNGTVDLRTGELRPHRRGDLITKVCDLDYDPNADCPLWLATMATFFRRPNPNDQALLIAYWQKLCGYSLAGVIRDHVLPVAYGTGSNGKSTILGTMMEVFGPDYAMKCPPDMLMAKKTDSHPTDRADLFGKRLVVAIETESARRLNETMIKELTGGDSIRARRMREDFWEFKPTHTLMMATNHKPGVRGTDRGIWRRLKLVPFTVIMDDSHADKSMPEKLRAEFPGILAWFVRGCLAWQQDGLTTPAEVTEATATYRREQDLIGAFLEECTTQEGSLRVKASELYARYAVWAEAGREYVGSLKMFCGAMEERGTERKISNGLWYLGIGLKPF